MMPEARGVMSQLKAMDPTSDHWMALDPPAMAPKPTMAPTMAWVVETGQPKKEAICSQMPVPRRAPHMPRIRAMGCPMKRSVSMMPL